jgi:hypothetical protein
MGVSILHLFIMVIVSDLFVLAQFYYGSFWFIDLLEEIFFQTVYLQIALIFFWVSPKVIRTELLIWKAYADKESGFFHWLEGRIKQRFPNFKTSAQRARERLDKPKKEEGKIGKWIKSRPPMERNFIRATIWILWGIMVGTFIFFLFNIDELVFDGEIEQTVEEIPEEEELPPTKPDGRPPPTIYDIFINEPDLVTP